jgi:ABC-2 type transport system ATP-binding protein
MPASSFVAFAGELSGLPRDEAISRAHEVLYYVGLEEARYRNVETYSTGMKQRVKLAQALVHDPKLLLLDEPTNGLDPAGRDEMLDLVKRTGTEFGIATVVASHLLGEIERVCTFLLAIDAGKLLRAAPIASFTEHTGTLGVEVLDGADALAERLSAAGLTARAEGATVMVDCPDERPYDIVRDAIDDMGLALVRMEQRRHRLEDLFRAEQTNDAA